MLVPDSDEDIVKVIMLKHDFINNTYVANITNNNLNYVKQFKKDESIQAVTDIATYADAVKKKHKLIFSWPGKKPDSDVEKDDDRVHQQHDDQVHQQHEDQLQQHEDQIEKHEDQVHEQHDDQVQQVHQDSYWPT